MKPNWWDGFAAVFLVATYAYLVLLGYVAIKTHDWTLLGSTTWLLVTIFYIRPRGHSR